MLHERSADPALHGTGMGMPPPSTSAGRPALMRGTGLRSPWVMLAVLSLLYCFSYVDRQLVALLLPNIKRSTGLSDTQLGVIVGPTATIAFSVATIFVGWAADRFSRRAILLLGMLIFGLGTLLFGLVGGFIALIAARMLASVGEASVAPPSWSLLSQEFARRRIATAISIFGMGSKAGNVLALGLGGAMVAAFSRSEYFRSFGGLAPWQLTFAAVSLVFIASAFLVLTIAEPNRTGVWADNRPDLMELRAFLYNERLVLGSSHVPVCAIECVEGSIA